MGHHFQWYLNNPNLKKPRFRIRLDSTSPVSATDSRSFRRRLGTDSTAPGCVAAPESAGKLSALDPISLSTALRRWVISIISERSHQPTPSSVPTRIQHKDPDSSSGQSFPVPASVSRLQLLQFSLSIPADDLALDRPSRLRGHLRPPPKFSASVLFQLRPSLAPDASNSNLLQLQLSPRAGRIFCSTAGIFDWLRR